MTKIRQVFPLVFIFTLFNLASIAETTPNEMHRVKIPTEGMVCGGCEGIINDQIAKKSGVIDVKANHKDSMVVVRFYPELISIEDIVKAINDLGYKAKAP